jgi:TATA-binding protein-associated factor Taf7
MEDRDRAELERLLKVARGNFDEALDPLTKERLNAYIRELEDRLRQPD